MKQSIGHLSIGLALFLASFANLGLAANQVKGTGWKAMTATAPAVAEDQNGTRYVAWQKAASNQILVATSPANSNTWTLLGSSEGGAGVVGGTTWTAGTSASPALAFNSQTNQIWLAYKGQSTPSDRIWFTSWNGTSWVSQKAVSCTNGTPKTGTAPALGGGDVMSLGWLGASGSDIWNTSWDGSGWGPQSTVNGSDPSWTAGTSTTPAWISPYFLGDPSVLFWKGISTGIWMSEYNAGSGWELQSKVACSTNPTWSYNTNFAPSAVYDNQPFEGAYVVFWTSSSSTSILYSYGAETSCGWSEPATVPGAATNAAPAVVFPLSGDYFVAWKKATNNTIWYYSFNTLKP